MNNAIFRRNELLLGGETMERIARKRVVIFGVGGVGSWCAESLVRSGIRQLTIVDSDHVSITNINRQLMATTKTVGQVKVDALKERLLTINPEAEITALQQIFSEETADGFQLETYDYIIDAIDSLKDKAALILLACQTKAKLFSSMGAALKLDPTRIQTAEFWKVKGDPLARALRNKLATNCWRTVVARRMTTRCLRCSTNLTPTARWRTLPPFSDSCWQDWWCRTSPRTHSLQA